MKQLIIVVGIIVIITVIYILKLFIVNRKDLLIYSIIALSLLWIGVGSFGFKYISSQQFKLSFDTIFNQGVEHKDSFEKEILVLPLPEHTVFAYRYSENAAAYFSTLSKDDIISFFKDHASKDSFITENSNLNNRNIVFKFTYKNTPYFINLRESIKPKGYYLYVESNSK